MQCWLLHLLSQQCRKKQLPIYQPIFHYDSSFHLRSGIFSPCPSVSGPDCEYRPSPVKPLCEFVSQPSEKLNVCLFEPEAASCLRTERNSEHRALTKGISTLQITLIKLSKGQVQKHLKQLHFPWLSYRGKVTKL